MDGEEGDSEVAGHYTVVKEEILGREEEIGGQDGPLLVAMQPGSEVPAVDHVEVVVMSDVQGGEHFVQAEDIANLVEDTTGEVVSVGAVEEVTEEHLKEVVRRVLSDNQAKIQQRQKRGHKRKVHESSSESSFDEESDSDDEPQRPRKTPKKREFSYRLQWKDDNMLEAMKAVTEKKMTIRGAAKAYSVPYSTLKDRVHGRVAHGTKPGVKTALSPEEEHELVKYIKDMEAAGFQLRCIDVRDRARDILQLHHGHNTPYKDCSPGHNWLAGFLKRHPGLEFKKAMNRGIVPSIPKQKAMCKRFYDITSQTYKKNRLSYKPERIYCMAEMRVTSFIDATILVCVSAEGMAIPPFVIFKGGQKNKVTAAKQAYPDAFFTCNQTGSVNKSLLLWWFRDHFLKKIPAVSHRPCVLFLGRAVGEVTFQFSQAAREERIHLISIPVGVAHILNPVDETLAAALERSIEKKAQKYETENPGQPFTQKAFAQILQKVWKKYIPKKDIIAKFSENGIYPVNPNVMTQERIAAAAAVLRESQQDPQSEEEEYEGSNKDFSGLSLLSALSSHEYASLEHFYEKGEGSKSEVTTPTSAELEEGEVVVKVNRRLQLQNRQEQDVDMEHTSIGRMARGDQAYIQVPVTPKKEKKQEEVPQPTIHEEIVAAKDNIDQINRAIASIAGGEQQEEGEVVTDGVITDETTDQITEEKVHIDQVVTEDVIDYNFEYETQQYETQQTYETQPSYENQHGYEAQYTDQDGIVYTEVVTEDNIQEETVQYSHFDGVGEVIEMDPSQVIEMGEIVQEVQEEPVQDVMQHMVDGQVYVQDHLQGQVIIRDEQGNFIEEQVISGEYMDGEEVEALLSQEIEIDQGMTAQQEFIEMQAQQMLEAGTSQQVTQVPAELLQQLLAGHGTVTTNGAGSTIINTNIPVGRGRKRVQPQVMPKIRQVIRTTPMVKTAPLPKATSIIRPQPPVIVSKSNPIVITPHKTGPRIIKVVQPKGMTLTAEQIQQIMQQAHLLQ